MTRTGVIVKLPETENAMEGKMSKDAKVEVTLVPELDLIERVLLAARGRLDMEDVLKLVELRHDCMKLASAQQNKALLEVLS